MVFHPTAVEGVMLIELEPHVDERGSFARAFCREEFRQHGIDLDIVQANVATSVRRATIRGLHYQVAPHAEAKLVRCTRGAVFDVALDLRPSSSTQGAWVGYELTPLNGRMLFVPAGCAHGYESLVDDTELFYFTSAIYAPGYERGVRFDDPHYGIEWPDVGQKTVSAKDRGWSLA